MTRTIMTLSLLASLGLGAMAQSGTIPQDVGVVQEQSGMVEASQVTSTYETLEPMMAATNATTAITTAEGQRTYVVMLGGHGVVEEQ